MLKGIIMAVKLDSQSESDFNNELEELTNLATACDIEIIDRVCQNLSDFNRNTYFGKGKVEELKMTIDALEAEIVVCNDELSSTQIANISTVIDILIYDRTYLILEIFKKRAKTKEALIQVELATLNYQLPRLQSLHDGFSRQRGAGGGFAHGRGAGETKLELDRRNITDRISGLKKDLKDLKMKRQQQRTLRNKSFIRTVCLVGYTNSGKSTTMNALLMNNKGSEKYVFEKDMLFATLETSTRNIETPKGSFLLTDTVGFIEKLPTQLIEAFKSTLEEIREADLIVHVVDCSNFKYLEQIKVTNEVLNELESNNIPMIYVFNKMDKCDGYVYIPNEFPEAIRISAKSLTNIDELENMILDKLYFDYKDVKYYIPYQNQSDMYDIKKEALFMNVNNTDEWIICECKVNEKMERKYKKYEKK